MSQKLKLVEGVAFAFAFIISFYFGAAVWAVPQSAKMNFADGGQGFNDRFILVTNSEIGELPIAASSNRLISTGIEALDRLCADYRVYKIEKWYPYPVKHDELKWVAERMYICYIEPGADIIAAIDAFAGDSHIQAAEPYRIPRPFYVPNDPHRSMQWFLGKINAYGAWDVVHGDATAAAIIGIVDTGVYWNHPDLAPNIWINAAEDLNHNKTLDAGDIDGIDNDGDGFIDDVLGWDFGVGDNNPQEESPTHGTHVAGCASEATNNYIGGCSIGWSAKILAVKGADAEGDLTAVWQAAVYAADRGAKILNFSWGAPGWSSTEQAQINSFYSMGVLVVAAAGNDDFWTPPYINYPSAYNHVLAVASTTTNDTKSSFSNYGSWVDVSAPGSDIYSTWSTNTYMNNSGTSMSSPITAGLAALLKAVDNSLTPDQITMLIKNNAVPIDTLNPGYAGMLGTGRINAGATLAGYAYIPGDANADGSVNSGDVTFLVRYLKGLGPAPASPFYRGDANGDCLVLGADVVYLVNYFKGGDSPIRGDCSR
jgi:subtilisin family serine protease